MTMTQRLQDLYTQVDAETENWEDSILVQILLQWECTKCGYVAPTSMDFENIQSLVKVHVLSECKVNLTSSELKLITEDGGEASNLEKRQLPSGTELKFMFAGKSYVTFVNLNQNERFTYKVSQAKESRDGNPAPHFISTLVGQNNTEDYTFIGTVFHNLDGDKFVYSRKSSMTGDAPSVMAFQYVFGQLVTGSLANFIQIWHEGRCCVCGKVLTTPESIQKGIGPVCEGGRI